MRPSNHAGAGLDFASSHTVASSTTATATQPTQVNSTNNTTSGSALTPTHWSSGWDPINELMNPTRQMGPFVPEYGMGSNNTSSQVVSLHDFQVMLSNFFKDTKLSNQWNQLLGSVKGVPILSHLYNGAGEDDLGWGRDYIVFLHVLVINRFFTPSSFPFQVLLYLVDISISAVCTVTSSSWTRKPRPFWSATVKRLEQWIRQWLDINVTPDIRSSFMKFW